MSLHSNFQRRDFLKGTLAASAAASLPAFVATPAGAANFAKQDVNSTLRVAIIGCGGRSSAHLSGWVGRNNSEVVAVVDPDEAKAQSRADAVHKKTGKRPVVYDNVRSAVDDDGIDIFSIATPNHWHALGAIWGLQAGKDVYVEKPVSHNVSEGRRIVQAARKYDRLCQFGAQCRTMKGSRDMVQFVLGGGIGEVKMARGLCFKPRGAIGKAGQYPVPENVNYSEWLGPAPELDYVPRPRFHYDWHWQWAYGNGDLGNQGIHQMDVARWGLGVDGLGESVISYGGRLGYEDAGETANTQVSIHSYGDKKLVFETRGLKTDALHGSKIGVIFYGSEGYAVQKSYGHSDIYDLDWKKTKEFKGGNTNDHFDNFAEAVRSRNVSDLNGEIEDGHLSSALCHLGNISYQMGAPASVSDLKSSLAGNEDNIETLERTVEHLKKNGVDLSKTKVALGPKLHLEGETFVGERAEEAKPHLTREYRAPFIVPEAKDV
ncbi:Gfo/Idh/MocA family protein [Calycomorphotria hydatis]|uniref:Putative oxidoreductase YcjS n=1 Tax=Calycomorphotria hydatis TaxID=2528027 RepID=A0A517T5E7_9PLAN|nr:Gfo/Idh/MocA family oxidoreductase [Calycomorphotria hydatis]QDT63599.1 putative oxidoreductase YcjS [Calycomorphotria hydatis]